MAQIFKPGMNTLCTLSIFAGAIAPFALLMTGSRITRAPYNTKVDVPLDQPAPFSHKHHAIELGIDCRFCHTGVEENATAGVPSTDVCMTCHSQVWTNSPNLEAVRQSWEADIALQWNKVNTVPDFVFFDHSIHVAKGVNCNNCHGPINKMPITWKGRDLRMMWCLDCHEKPEQYLYKDPKHPEMTPREQVFNFYRKLATGEKLTPEEEELAIGEVQRIPNDKIHSEGIKAMKDRKVNVVQLKDCWVCHR